MIDGFKVTLTGVDELTKKLNGISVMTRGKAGRFALRKAANLIAAQAKANALEIDDPETAKSIADNIVVQFATKTFKKTGDLVFRIGVKGGATNPGTAGDTTWYWRFVELGTSKIPPRPFMRSALSENAQAAGDEFIAQYDKSLTRFLKRWLS